MFSLLELNYICLEYFWHLRKRVLALLDLLLGQTLREVPIGMTKPSTEEYVTVKNETYKQTSQMAEQQDL